MWNKKNDTNEFIYKTETDSQTQKTNVQLPKEKVWQGRINQEFGSNIHALLYIKQQGPTVQHKSLYSIFDNNIQEKSLKKNIYIHIYIYACVCV